MDNIAYDILKYIGINPVEVTRFTTGYCHSVYHVKTVNEEYVLRITCSNNAEYYFGSIKWLSELAQHGLPLPRLIKNGKYEDMHFALISYIHGVDLDEVYSGLNSCQKYEIAKELSNIQRIVSTLPNGNYGYNEFATWREYLQTIIDRASQRIKKNGVFDPSVCDKIKFDDDLTVYFMNVKPTAFLNDITTKNVLINDGKLAGIVDIDEMCYGDPLLTVGLTKMALLIAEADTDYIDFWLDEMNATDIERQAVRFYTLLFCFDFMSEQGMRFDNGKEVIRDKIIIDRLSYYFNYLIG